MKIPGYNKKKKRNPESTEMNKNKKAISSSINQQQPQIYSIFRIRNQKSRDSFFIFKFCSGKIEEMEPAINENNVEPFSVFFLGSESLSKE